MDTIVTTSQKPNAFLEELRVLLDISPTSELRLNGPVKCTLAPIYDNRPDSPKCTNTYNCDGLAFEQMTHSDGFDLQIVGQGQESCYFMVPNKPRPKLILEKDDSKNILTLIMTGIDYEYKLSIEYPLKTTQNNLELQQSFTLDNYSAVRMPEATHIKAPTASRYGIPTINIALNVVWRIDPDTNQKQYLLVQESAEKKEAYTWYLPAGKVDLGESIIAGALRETKEEAGVDIEIIGVIGVQNINYSSQDRTKTRYIFSARQVGNEPPKQLADNDSVQAKWFTYDEIMSLPLRADEVLKWVGHIERDKQVVSMSFFEFYNH